MGKFQRLLHNQQVQQDIEDNDARTAAEWVFREWRNRYVAQLCAYIRTYTKAAEIGTELPTPLHSLEWCNAAVSILTVAPVDVQDAFLRSKMPVKNRMVAAVIEDGYVADLDGRMIELPVL